MWKLMPTPFVHEDKTMAENISEMHHLRDESVRQSVMQNLSAQAVQSTVDDIWILPKYLNQLDIGAQVQDIDIEIPWLEEIHDLLLAIQSAWGTSYLVWGSIRDPLLWRVPKDLDIEVHGLEYDELMSILEDHRWEPDVKNEDYGILAEAKNENGGFTGVIMFQPVGSTASEPLDFSLPRTETSTWWWKGWFEFEHNPHMSIKLAAKRRENTINAVMYDPLNKKLHDPYGGLQDLVDKKMRMIDEVSFMEDPSRVVRLIPFESRFGFEPDDKLMEVCIYMTHTWMLDYIPAVKDENDKVIKAKEWIPWELRYKIFDKMMEKGVDYGKFFWFLRETGIGERYFPYLMNMIYTPQDPDHHPEGNVEIHTVQVMQKIREICIREWITGDDRKVLMYAALFHDVAKYDVTDYNGKKITSYGHEHAWEDYVRKFFTFFAIKNTKTSNEIVERVVACVKEHMVHYKIEASWSIDRKKYHYRKLIKRISPHGRTLDLLRLMEADKLWRNNADAKLPEARYELAWLYENCWWDELPKPFVTGQDLKDRGFEGGIHLWNRHRKIVDLQYAETFTDKQDALRRLDQKLALEEDILQIPTESVQNTKQNFMPEWWSSENFWPKR